MSAPVTPALLYLDNVTVSFDGFRALNALSLAVDHAEMRAIIGPNGAGKTTMMDVITGKTRPTAGPALLGGRHAPPGARERRHAAPDGRHGLVRGSLRPHRPRRGRHRRARHRPQVPDS